MTHNTLNWFLKALWPEGLSQGLHQLVNVTSGSIIDEVTSDQTFSEEQRNEAVREALVRHVEYTKCITPATLKGLLIARRASSSNPIARQEPEARWTLRQANDIIHVGNQILLEDDITQETMGWFVRAIWQDTLSQVATCLPHHDGQSTIPTNSISEGLVSPVIRDEFVQRVLEQTKITDPILDWLRTAVIRIAKKRAFAIECLDSFGNDEDESDTLGEERSGDEDPLLEQPDLSCGNDTTKSDKENPLPSQSAAAFSIWSSSSKLTTPLPAHPLPAQGPGSCKPPFISTTPFPLMTIFPMTIHRTLFFLVSSKSSFPVLSAMLSSDLQTRAHAAMKASMMGGGVREASRKWDVPRSYVRRRIEGVPTFKEARQAQQLLSPLLEAQLARWAIGQARLGYAPALVKFRYMAQRMIQASGGTQEVGKAWHQRFLARNPEVKSTRSHIINYSRVNGASVANINIFFDRLDIAEIGEITPDRFFNCDEIGIGQGVGGDHFVICEAETHIALKKDVEKGEWITALECVSGTGVALPPLMIFRGKDIQSQWFPDRGTRKYDNWRFTTSPKGWTSNEVAMNWLQDIFIPHIRRHIGNKWVVLICDGHDSHTNDAFLWLCITNKIWLVFYEPHCSHVVQVLDVGVFGLVKKRLRFYLRGSGAAMLGLKPSKREVIEAYYQAREDAMTVVAIKKAWATSGIHPRDRSRPLSSKYVMLESEGVARAPAQTSSTISGPKSPDFLLLRGPKPINTPAGGQELIRKSRQLADHDRTFRNPTQTLFARKASKALDLQAGRIAELEAQVTILTAQLERKQRKKRKAVKVPPGERFVKMAAIRRVKRRLRNRVVYDDETSDIDMAGKGTGFEEEVFSDETEAEDCIDIPSGR